MIHIYIHFYVHRMVRWLSPLHAYCSLKLTEKPEKSDDGSVSLDRRRLPQSVARKTTESATSTSSDAIVECHLCKKNVSEAKADIRHKKWSSACSKLVKVLTFVHEKDPTHPAMVDESCNLLVDAIGQDFSAGDVG